MSRFRSTALAGILVPAGDRNVRGMFTFENGTTGDIVFVRVDETLTLR